MRSDVPSVSGRVLPAVWKLLRLQVRLAINSFRHAKLIVKVFRVIGLVALAALAGFIIFLSRLMLQFLRSPGLEKMAGLDIASLLSSVPGFVLTALFFGILFTSFGVLLQALYLTGDMDFLLAAPVPIRAVFVSKLIQAILPNFGLIALFGLPLLYGLGISGGYSPVYYPSVLIVMAALALSAAGLASLLVMAVVRVLPPRRAAEILGFIGATAGVLCAQSGNLSQSFGRDIGLSGSTLTGAASLLTRAAQWQLPLNWAGQGLVDIGEARWLPGFGLLGATLAVTGLAFMVALVTAEALYYNGWAGMQVVARKTRPASSPRGAGAPWRRRLLPGPIQGILSKDFILMRRDLRNLSQLISPLIVGIFLTLSVLRAGERIPAGSGSDVPAWLLAARQMFPAYGSAGIALFMGWLLLSRLAGMSFAQEGRNYWILKSSPTTARQMLIGKFLVAYLPAIAVSTVYLVSAAWLEGAAAGLAFYMVVAVAGCLAGANGMLLGFGAAGANLHWDDPRRMNAGALGCLGQIVTAVFLPVAFVLFAGPLIGAMALKLPAWAGYAAGLVLGGIGSLVGVVLPMLLAEKRVQQLDEA